MDLIIQPTNACNFNCTFCAASKLKSNMLDIEVIKSFIKNNDIKTIEFLGGEPLILGPTYYKKILNFIEEEQLDINISFTSNLSIWYKNPVVWKEIFTHNNVRVCTSFQYGEGRVKENGETFLEKDFLQYQNKWFDYYGEYLPFISVITNENDKFAIDNVLLAKSMNTKCRLNGANKLGKQSVPYPLNNLYYIYYDLFLSGLYKFELENCENIIRYFLNLKTSCPILGLGCKDNIRCIDNLGKIHVCSSGINIEDCTIDKYFKKECLLCDAHDICYGCKKIMRDLEHYTLQCEDLRYIMSVIKKHILDNKTLLLEFLNEKYL